MKGVPKKQLLAPELVKQLLAHIRMKCYREHPIEFAKQRKDLVRMVITWPAAWLLKRGVALPPEQYQAKLAAILDDALEHCAAARVNYLPAYLATCVQRHFKCNEQGIYDHAKALRDNVGAVVGRVRIGLAPGRSVTDDLAAMHKLMKTAKRAPRIETMTVGQKELF